MLGRSACAGPLPTLADLGKLSRAGPGEFLAKGLKEELRTGRKTRHTSSSLWPRESGKASHTLSVTSPGVDLSSEQIVQFEASPLRKKSCVCFHICSISLDDGVFV